MRQLPPRVHPRRRVHRLAKIPFCNGSRTSCVIMGEMASRVPISILDLRKTIGRDIQALSEPIYGGYENGRGQICLFGKALVYRLNFKYNTAQERPPLNSGAQARYDATQAGETFEYCSVKFRRLSRVQIAEICSSGAFRVTLAAI